MTRLPLRALPALLALLIAGCASPVGKQSKIHGPYYEPQNIRKAASLPAEVRRVALLPLATSGPRLPEDTLITLDHIFGAALNATARAEVAQVDRTQLGYLSGSRSLPTNAVWPNGVMAKVVSTTGADAILMVDITAYSPYPPLTIGVRARLINLSTGDELWNFDNLFTTANPEVANAARAYNHSSQAAHKGAGDFTDTVLQNPDIFARYVAEATFTTLPNR